MQQGQAEIKEEMRITREQNKCTRKDNLELKTENKEIKVKLEVHSTLEWIARERRKYNLVVREF